mgnify:FL=1
MNAHADKSNTVRKHLPVDAPPSLTQAVGKETHSTTMRIPVEEIFDDIAVRHVSGLEIRLPDNPTPISRPLVNREITIGRVDEADVSIPTNSISRMHARIFPHNEEFVIEDLDSTNGTYVNGVRINRCVLRHNDLIRIGDATILFSQQKQWGS